METSRLESKNLLQQNTELQQALLTAREQLKQRFQQQQQQHEQQQLQLQQQQQQQQQLQQQSDQAEQGSPPSTSSVTGNSESEVSLILNGEKGDYESTGDDIGGDDVGGDDVSGDHQSDEGDKNRNDSIRNDSNSSSYSIVDYESDQTTASERTHARADSLGIDDINQTIVVIITHIYLFHYKIFENRKVFSSVAQL